MNTNHVHLHTPIIYSWWCYSILLFMIHLLEVADMSFTYSGGHSASHLVVVKQHLKSTYVCCLRH